MKIVTSGNLVIWQSGNLKAPESTRQRQLPDYQITRLPNRTAFTLIELLLALAISATVAAAITSAMYTAFRTKSNIEDALEATRASDIAADTLSTELALALPPTASNAASTTLQLSSSLNTLDQTLIGPFVGDAASLDFFASGPESKADLQPDIREIQYLLIPDPQATTPTANKANTQLLIRRVRTNLLEDNPQDPPDVVLARDVINFTLSYYDGSNWTDTWDSTQLATPSGPTAIPVAVQFTLELAPIKAGSANSRLTTRIVPLPCAQPASSTTGGF